MNVINTFSKNWFNLFDLFAVTFVIANSRSMGQIVHFMILIVAISAALHLYDWSQKRKQQAEPAEAY